MWIPVNPTVHFFLFHLYLCKCPHFVINKDFLLLLLLQILYLFWLPFILLFNIILHLLHYTVADPSTSSSSIVASAIYKCSEESLAREDLWCVKLSVQVLHLCISGAQCQLSRAGPRWGLSISCMHILDCDRKRYADTEKLCHTHARARRNLICVTSLLLIIWMILTTMTTMRKGFVSQLVSSGGLNNDKPGKKLLLQLRLHRLSTSDTKELFQPASRFPKS